MFFLNIDSFCVVTVDEYNNLTGNDRPVINHSGNWNGIIVVNANMVPDDYAIRRQHIKNLYSIGSEDLRQIVIMDEYHNSIIADLHEEFVSVNLLGTSGLAARTNRFEYIPYGGEYGVKKYYIFVNDVTRADKQVLDSFPGNVIIQLVYYNQVDMNIITALQGSHPNSIFVKGDAWSQ